MTRVAAVDCGTNSIRLLVVDAGGTGAPAELLRRTEIVRLGEGVDETGRFAPQALGRVRDRLTEYAAACRDLDVERVRFAATSAARDVGNPEALAAVVSDVLAPWGTDLEVLPGSEEARLTYLGAVGAVRADGLPGPWLVVDIGGGSTELVRGGDDVDRACSLDIGAVRLHERHRPADPPTAADVAAIVADVDAALDRGLAEVPLDGVRTLVGVAGTSTTVTAHALRLERYDAARVHLTRSTPAAVVRAAHELVALPLAARRSLGFMVPGREDVIGTGALEWARVVQRAADAGVEDVVVSERDLLDGLVADLLAATP